MALMFSRLAHNFVKNGYYPTDEVTLGRILQALDAPADRIAILDPCCGEGGALADLRTHLVELGSEPMAYGVEYDSGRAANARQWLDVVAHADIADMAIKVRQFGLLFLNPPYGDLVGDQAQLDTAAGGRKRLEKLFYRTAHPWLAHDGVLVLIVPHTVFDAEFAHMVAKSYRDVRVYMAPEQQFKQCVLFGIKRRHDRLDLDLARQLEAMGTGQLPPELPEHWSAPLYQVPKCPLDAIHFVASRITGEGLQHELAKQARSTLWPQFEQHFGGQVQTHRRPLRALRDWHLALALAAGQISGVVHSRDGRILLVKGDTHKDRSLKVSFEEVGKKGDLREVRTFTDKFVPVIRAIDFTPGPMLGTLVTIQ
jgi:tRNA1(Val) A37 N6-methylase TrmN6